MVGGPVPSRKLVDHMNHPGGNARKRGRDGLAGWPPPLMFWGSLIGVLMSHVINPLASMPLSSNDLMILRISPIS